jgi:hypothetical protein
MNFPQNQEIFRAVDGYLNYEVSNHGRVRNSITGKILKPNKGNHGYYRIRLSKDGGVKIHYMHRLVCFTFVDNPENKTVVDHIDRNKSNNYYENLRWSTISENQKNRTINNNNKSGKLGISQLKKCYVATICNNEGKQIRKSFSSNKYGEAQSLQLAIAQRKLWELEFNYQGE